MLKEQSCVDEALVAAHDFAQSMVTRADGTLDRGTSPFWHGWALMVAFQAGVAWERNNVARGNNDTVTTDVSA